MTEIPGLEVSVLEAPFAHLLDRPFASRLQIRRPGEPWAIHVREHVHRLHHHGVAGALLANLPEHVLVDTFVGVKRDEAGQGQQNCQERNDESSHGFLNSE
jgi:hypothetical protein